MYKTTKVAGQENKDFKDHNRTCKLRPMGFDKTDHTWTSFNMFKANIWETQIIKSTLDFHSKPYLNVFSKKNQFQHTSLKTLSM